MLRNRKFQLLRQSAVFTATPLIWLIANKLAKRSPVWQTSQWLVWWKSENEKEKLKGLVRLSRKNDIKFINYLTLTPAGGVCEEKRPKSQFRTKPYYWIDNIFFRYYFPFHFNNFYYNQNFWKTILALKRLISKISKNISFFLYDWKQVKIRGFFVRQMNFSRKFNKKRL